MPQEVDGDGRGYSAAITSAISGIAVFLGGFAFAALTVLLSLHEHSVYFQCVFFVTTLSALLWVGLAALGAFLTVAAQTVHLLSGSPLLNVATVFVTSVYVALALFFINVTMLAFLVSAIVGIATAVVSVFVGVALFALVTRIALHW